MIQQGKQGERYLRIKEGAAMLSVHPCTILHWVADGRFGEILRLTPKDYRIAESDLQKFIRSRTA